MRHTLRAPPAISGFDTTGSSDALLIGGNLSFLGASETTTSATLSFSDNLTLKLNGDYVGGTFTPQSQGGGVLKITY